MPVLMNLQNRLNSICALIFNFPNVLLVALWGNIYLIYAKSVTPGNAAFLFGVFSVGYTVGIFLVGRLCDYYPNHRKQIVLSGIIGTLLSLICVACYQGGEYWTLAGMFFVLGMCADAQIVNYPLIVLQNPFSFTSRAMSLLSLIINLGAALAQSLFGYFIYLPTDTVSLTKTAHSLNIAFWFFPIAAFFNMLLALF